MSEFLADPAPIARICGHRVPYALKGTQYDLCGSAYCEAQMYED